jgi:hypothetical protein
MGFYADRYGVTDEPQQVYHPDHDSKSGYSVTARCDSADIVVGGPELTPATGYLIAAGTEWGWSSDSGAPYVMLAVGAGPTEMQCLWDGV